VEFPKISDKDILHLNKASRTLKLHRLGYLCEKWLVQNMTVEGVFHLLKAATDLDEERIKGFCVQFALGHYNDFIANKDGIRILGIDLFQEVVTARQSNPAPPKEVNPEDVPDTLLADFKRMYEQMPYADVTVPIGNENIKCHRCILAAHSDTMANAIVKEPETEARMSPAAFASMLKFCYYGFDDVETLAACELVSFSRKFNLTDFVSICETCIRTNITTDTVLKILAVSYLPSQGKQDLVDELRGKCLPFLLNNLDSISFGAIRSYNPLMIVDLLLELQSASKKGTLNFSSNSDSNAEKSNK